MGQQAISDSSGFHSALRRPSTQTVSKNFLEDATNLRPEFTSLAEKTPEGLWAISLLVSGVHCAACIHTIESAIRKRPAVKAARLNYTTRRLTLLWEGRPEDVQTYVQTLEKHGYTARPYDERIEGDESRQEEKFLLMCMGVAGFAMGNIMLLSVGLWITSAETMGGATRDFLHWVSAFIAVPAVLYAGRPFFRSAAKALKSGRTNMDVPISLGVTLACGMSLFETLQHGEHVYFDSAVMLIFFLLIGRYFDIRARRTARSAALGLLSSIGDFATLLDQGTLRRIPVKDLNAGMIVSVAAGEKCPADGEILEGVSQVDQSMLTGETEPEPLNPGDRIFAGTLNLDAPVVVKVTQTGERTLLADIARLMEKAGQGQARYVSIADRAARLYTPVVHILAALAFFSWWLLGGLDWQEALMIAVTVLIITCPCALGLAVPVVQVLATGRLMREGIFIKAGDALERLAAIDTVFIDKTGTLTRGAPVLQAGAYNESDLQIAASLAAHSAHPLARTMALAYAGPSLEFQAVREEPGYGLEGTHKGQIVRMGRPEWCGAEHKDIAKGMQLCLAVSGKPPVFFYFKDALRSDACQTVSELQSEGLRMIILSGDREDIVKEIAAACGIQSAHAQLSPVDKYNILEEQKAQGHKAAMIGDGLNDAPVLAAAHVSIAPGTASDLTQKAADVVFMGEKLGSVLNAYHTARKTQKLVRQNFMLALGYNCIAVPIAFMGLLTPALAALAMSASSLCVIANAARISGIRKAKP